MAENLVTNQILQGTWFCQASDQISQTVRHWQVTSLAGTGSTVEAAAAALSQKFGTHLSHLMPTTALYVGMKLQVIKPTKLIAVYSTNGGAFGDYTGALCPKQAAGVLALKTRLAGRSYQGRCYLPFPSEDANDAVGNPAAGYLAFSDAFGADIVQAQVVGTAPNQATLTPVIYSRKLNSWEPLTAYVSRQRWGTVRRRSGIAGGDQLPF